MGKEKPRHNPQKPQNNIKHCAYDDGTRGKECNRPWLYRCDGNMYKCRKLYLQYLASLSDKKRAEFIDDAIDKVTCELTALKEDFDRKHSETFRCYTKLCKALGCAKEYIENCKKQLEELSASDENFSTQAD